MLLLADDVQCEIFQSQFFTATWQWDRRSCGPIPERCEVDP
jgi:hypothetical protein